MAVLPVKQAQKYNERSVMLFYLIKCDDQIDEYAKRR